MKSRANLLGAGVAALAAVVLAGCSSTPLANTPAALDSAYGIPANSVPSEVERPDGMLYNGLVPAQPNDGS